MYRALVTAVVLAGLAAPLTAAADGHAKAMEKAVKARQGLYQVYAFNLGQLGAMAKGEAEFNAEAAQTAADNLVGATNLKMGAAWPQGSDNTGIMKGKTRAKPEIWSTYPAIAEKGKALKTAAAALQANAGSLDGIRANIGAVGAACKGCHETYRAKDF